MCVVGVLGCVCCMFGGLVVHVCDMFGMDLFLLLWYALGMWVACLVCVSVCCVLSCFLGHALWMLGACMLHVWFVFVVCLGMFGACVLHVCGMGVFCVLFCVCLVWGWCLFAM